MCRMLPDLFHQALHDHFFFAFLFQNFQTGVRRRSLHQPADRIPAYARQCGMGGKQLTPAVCNPGMRIHNATRQLDKLADVTDQYDL